MTLLVYVPRLTLGSAITGLTVAMFLSGCHTPRPDPAAEQTISRVSGIGEPVAFRVEGGPLDEPSAGATLTMAEAIRRAVSTDPGLQAALARVRVAMADADQARLLPNPVLNIIVRWGAGTPQIEASLAQDFVAVLQLARRADAADNRMRMAAAEAATTALDLVAEVQERYAGAQAMGELVPMLEERADLAGRLSRLASNRLAAGEGSRADVTTLEAQRVDLDVRLADARLDRDEARLRLARLVGEPSGAAAWHLDPWNSPDAVSTDESGWINAALAYRPEIQALAWELAALQDDEALTDLLPWEGADAGVDAQRDDGWSVGPSISTPLPVFDTGRARQDRVTAEQIEVRHRLTLAKRTVVEEVRTAWLALVANTDNLRRVRQELIPLQQRRREQAEAAFRAGQTDVTPLLLAEQEVREANANAVEIERRTTFARIRLHRAVGGPGVAPAAEDPAVAAIDHSVSSPSRTRR